MSSNGFWQASWIWSEGEASPRNEWRCFRKSFVYECGKNERAVLKITADSRYLLYVNGIRAGRGPVRSWPFELAYDEYDITGLLHRGGPNTIAVLTAHYGIPTFQYLRGRGGLLVQVENACGSGRRVVLHTDRTWRTALHEGLDARSSRISCQLPFTEVMDARLWDSGWTETDWDDSGWAEATELGPVGMEPWITLKPRDIPMLTEEPVQPVRIESLSRVKPRSWGVVLDLRSHFVPDSQFHANNVQFSGYLATVIRTAVPARAVIGFVDGGRLSGPFSINGKWLETDAYYGEGLQRYTDVQLEAGDNLFVMDIQGITHGHGFHMGIDCGEPFQVVSPLGLAGLEAGPGDTSAFIGIGPFAEQEFNDQKPSSPWNPEHPAYIRARDVQSLEDLAAFRPWIRPVALQHASREDVFSLFVWHRSEVRLPVPYSLHNAVIAHDEPAIIPVYGEEVTELVIDFGKEYSGYMEFEVEAAAGTILDFYGFEYMRDGWRQDTYQLDNTMRYVCREGRQTYSSLIRRGLRYLAVAVRNAACAPRLYRIRLLQSNYPVAELGRFHCSDPLLNDIWTISQHTTRLCMEDTFVDCPAYEQAFWVGDARNEALISYYLFGDQELVKRCLRLVPGSRFQSPLYVDQVPSGWVSIIPNWTFFWVIACTEFIQFSGQHSFAEEIWPHIRFTLDHYLEQLDAQGLLNMKGWNFLDWAPIDQPSEGVVTHQNMFLVKALQAAALLADNIEPDGAALYRSRADKLRDAINARLWSEEQQAYVDCIHTSGQFSRIFSMQTQVVALLSGIPEGERLGRVEALIASPPDSFVQIGSPFMSFFYYEALAKLKRYDTMLADLRRQYGLMVEHGATTCWETYPRPLEKRSHPLEATRSHCHAWSAGPGYFLGRHVLGVRGEGDGWQRVIVEPQLADLDWAAGAVPLPSGGRLDISWRADRMNRRLLIRIEAPSGLDLSIIPPHGYEVVTEEFRLGKPDGLHL